MSPDLLFCTISFCDNSSKIHESIHLFYICSIQCKFGFYTRVNSLCLVFVALIFSSAFFASSCSFAIFISVTTGRWLLLCHSITNHTEVVQYYVRYKVKSSKQRIMTVYYSFSPNQLLRKSYLRAPTFTSRTLSLAPPTLNTVLLLIFWTIMYYNASQHAKCPLLSFILTKSGFSQQISVKILKINFHKCPQSWSQVVPCWQMDGHDTRHFQQFFCEHVQELREKFSFKLRYFFTPQFLIFKIFNYIMCMTKYNTDHTSEKVMSHIKLLRFKVTHTLFTCLLACKDCTLNFKRKEEITPC